ncbi:hypothetical protein [Paenibacillus ginsengarvi]|uniref:Uncharacterized protein n=1 Tax=Paenibacillus ginsengarvi TaxID=400777 RepID=A0A3B0BRJ6_9BACL|nr:hypothetical protein [Paenibacillus ginsengarvi]RKN75004.1 hypothetical protein D7M11_26060 [Paenibacillus ginsengarvi]
MINVGRVVLSRNFAQPKGFKVYRTTGAWANGRFVLDPEKQLTLQGTVTVANADDLEQIPEGDRVSGMICSYSPQPIYVTRADGEESPGVSDEIEWRGERYRVKAVLPWIDFGYYKAFGERMAGD